MIATLITLMLGQVGPMDATLSIRDRYRAIVAEQRKEITQAGSEVEVRSRIVERTRSKLEALLTDAEASGEAALVESDYIALSQIAGRLRRNELALSFAHRAVTHAQSVEAYIALVECLCRADRLTAAEAAVRVGLARFPESEKRYLLHNVIAFKYRAAGKSDDAFVNMKKTVDLLVCQVAISPFYVGHLGRCLDELNDMATACGCFSEVKLNGDRWHASIEECLSQRRMRIEEARCGFKPTEGDLLALRYEHLALAVVDERISPVNVEAAFDRWLLTLLQCENISPAYGAWLDEITEYLSAVTAFLSPEFAGALIATRLDQLIAMLDRAPDDRSLLEKRDATRRDAHAVVRVLRQHRHYMSLVGRTVFTAERMNEINPSNSKFIIVHVMNPSLRTAPRGVQALQVVRSGRFAQPDLGVAVLSTQCGLVWDPSTRKFSRAAGQTTERESEALVQLGRMMRLPGLVHLLVEGSAEAKSLQANELPVNLLIDANGTLRCALIGSEREKLLRLIALTNDAPRPDTK